MRKLQIRENKIFTIKETARKACNQIQGFNISTPNLMLLPLM